jgi:ABC-type Mn2+/Zn2+ transport system ATPase subunit
MGGQLDLQGLQRTFGTITALDDLSFSVTSGRVVGFLGPNGAGKTTTMRAVFGLTDLNAGSVRWNGSPVGQAERRRLAYLPPTAPFAMPVLVGLHQVAWWQFLLSVLISIAGTALMARLAAEVYRRAVLQSGRRVSLRELRTRRTRPAPARAPG